MFPFLPTAKNIFRVRFQDQSQGQSHTLQGNDIFHKQQWLNCLRRAMSDHRPALQAAPDPEAARPDAAERQHKRRSSVASAIVHMEEADENCPQPACPAPGSPEAEHPSAQTAAPSESAPSSPTTPATSPSPPHKAKKEKKSRCSLGKRKETMV